MNFDWMGLGFVVFGVVIGVLGHDQIVHDVKEVHSRIRAALKMLIFGTRKP